MAPEQMETPLEVDHRADIYSLGVVFYEMLTGELPLGRFAPPSRKYQLDDRLDDVVLRTLEKEPERRDQRVCEVKTDVESLSFPSAHFAPPSDRKSSWAGIIDPAVKRRQSWLLIPLLCATWVAYALTSNSDEPIPVPYKASSIVLAIGIGLWALWRFLRGDSAEDIVKLDPSKNGHLDAARKMRPRLLLIPIFCAAFIVHFLYWGTGRPIDPGILNAFRHSSFF